MIAYRARLVRPVTAPDITDGVVVVDGDRIAWVGPTARAPAAEMRRLGGKRGPFAMDARLAAEWDAASYRVMEAACAAKAAHAEFRRALALTGNRVLVHQVRGHADVRLSRILHALRAGLSV